MYAEGSFARQVFNMGEKISSFRFSIRIDPNWANVVIGLEMTKGIEDLIPTDS